MTAVPDMRRLLRTLVLASTTLHERGLTDDQLTQGGTLDCNPSQRPLGP